MAVLLSVLMAVAVLTGIQLEAGMYVMQHKHKQQKQHIQHQRFFADRFYSGEAEQDKTPAHTAGKLGATGGPFRQLRTRLAAIKRKYEEPKKEGPMSWHQARNTFHQLAAGGMAATAYFGVAMGVSTLELAGLTAAAGLFLQPGLNCIHRFFENPHHTLFGDFGGHKHSDKHDTSSYPHTESTFGRHWGSDSMHTQTALAQRSEKSLHRQHQEGPVPFKHAPIDMAIVAYEVLSYFRPSHEGNSAPRVPKFRLKKAVAAGDAPAEAEEAVKADEAPGAAGAVEEGKSQQPWGAPASSFPGSITKLSMPAACVCAIIMVIASFGVGLGIGICVILVVRGAVARDATLQFTPRSNMEYIYGKDSLFIDEPFTPRTQSTAADSGHFYGGWNGGYHS